MDVETAMRTVVDETLGRYGLLFCARCSRDIDLAAFERIHDALDYLQPRMKDCATFPREFVVALVNLSQHIPELLGAYCRPSNAPTPPPQLEAAEKTSMRVLEFVEDWSGFKAAITRGEEWEDG